VVKLGSGYIVNADEVDTLVFDWGNIKFFSEPEVTGASRFSFGMVILSPGKGHERHNHPGTEEIIFVVSGEGEQMVDDQPAVHVRPGSSIFIPDGVNHSTVNTGWEPMRLIVVYAPPGSERGLRDIPDCRVLPPGQTPE
jgi:oxalate decarboxylase/phosphoglucose isomerase-like protein (cupin superfamily)